MTFNDKIDEWIKEAEARPSSALLILKLVANRLRDLTERNEQLLAENIALQDGTRVQEYQKRIVHLERQLEMLKRRSGEENLAAEQSVEAQPLSLLVYNAQGQILRFALRDNLNPLAALRGELAPQGEFPRLLAVHPQEELLFLFTSGRVSALRAEEIPLAEGEVFSWDMAAQPDEPRAGAQLAALMPLSRLPLADFFLQFSRRGSVKKTLTSLAQSILDNHYLGRGVIQKSDQPFDALLCQKGARCVLVTYEGRLLGIDVDDLSYSAEERIRLSATDYVIAAFTLQPRQTILCVTQNGKIIQRAAELVDVAKSAASRGQALISPSRLEQGVRFIGAVVLNDADKLAALDAEGQLTVYDAAQAASAGTLQAGAALLSIGVIPAKA